MEYSVCTKCGVKKELSCFSKRSSTKLGHVSACKECSSKISADWYKKNREDILEVHKKWKASNVEHHKEYNKKWKIENKEKISEQNKELYIKNRSLRKEQSHRVYLLKAEQVIERTNKWKKDNPDKLKEIRKRVYLKARSSPKGLVDSSMSSSIRLSLKGNKKGQKWESLVGYTASDLVKHLQQQFSGDMDWNNYGKVWEIDHIIPKSVFNYETPLDLDFKRCWSLMNLRPLYVSENRKKYCKLLKKFQPALLISASCGGV